MATKKTGNLEMQEEINETVQEENALAEQETAEDQTEAVESEVEELLPEEVATAEEEPAAQDGENSKSIDEDIQRRSSRFSHEIAKASRQKKKEMYTSQHVITENGDDEVETDATQLREDYLDLVASASPKSNRILEGTIIGYSYAGETRKSTLLAKVEYGHGLFEVLIPSYLLYDYDLSKYVDSNQLQIIENNLKSRINSRVKFIVRHVDEKARQALGDRLSAQSIIGHNNYVRITRSGKPRIFEGLIVQSQVIHTAARGIVVDALGVDIMIPKTELSHSYVGDAREEYQTGDVVNVKVTDIGEKNVTKYENSYKLITAKGSIKAAMPDKRPSLYRQFKVDGIYSATITYIEEAGVYCRLAGGMDCLCALPRFGQNPKRGQKRVVRVTAKDDEKLFIYGIFERN